MFYFNFEIILIFIIISRYVKMVFNIFVFIFCFIFVLIEVVNIEVVIMFKVVGINIYFILLGGKLGIF